MSETPIRCVLIANRGEIAVRIIRACRDLGLESVAVHSDADADALHVRLADKAVAIGPSPARQSYLRVDVIVDAAVSACADAVHPGYGFLAEVPAPPRACAEAGLRFVGPPADVMEAVGDKVTARQAAERAGVPVVPGTGRVRDIAMAEAAAEEIGYPVLLKASAGGGGRGIRTVTTPEELRTAFPQASAEAQAAFGDRGMFIEKYIQQPRHVEVQVMADEHGSVMHLFERECSIQASTSSPSSCAWRAACRCRSAMTTSAARGRRLSSGSTPRTRRRLPAVTGEDRVHAAARRARRARRHRRDGGLLGASVL